jgi:hypothetical protein
MANKYSSIWDTLKDKRHVTLAIPVPLQKRVIRGVINLKDRDRIFKLQAAEAKKRFIIRYLIDGARVRLFLREYNDVSALTISDL